MITDSDKIGVPEMFESLLRVIPSAEEGWHEYLKDFRDEEAHFIGISAFSHAVAELFATERVESFAEIFLVIEELIVRGDEQVKGLMIVGFLENLQNKLSWTSNGFSQVEQWLGEESLKGWRYIEEVWVGKSSLMDVIRDGKED